MTLFCLITAFQTFAQSPSDLPTVKSPVFKTDTLTITTFGAIPDGLTLNTSAINKAIDQCSRAGGGVVLVPRGLWLTGPIVLKSNVNLRLNRDALIQFTDQRDAVSTGPDDLGRRRGHSESGTRFRYRPGERSHHGRGHSGWGR